MKRIQANYHTLHVLNLTQAKLRKAIVSNSDRNHVNCICERVLNVRKSNIALTGYDNAQTSQSYVSSRLTRR